MDDFKIDEDEKLNENQAIIDQNPDEVPDINGAVQDLYTEWQNYGLRNTQMIFFHFSKTDNLYEVSKLIDSSINQLLTVILEVLKYVSPFFLMKIAIKLLVHLARDYYDPYIYDITENDDIYKYLADIFKLDHSLGPDIFAFLSICMRNDYYTPCHFLYFVDFDYIENLFRQEYLKFQGLQENLAEFLYLIHRTKSDTFDFNIYYNSVTNIIFNHYFVIPHDARKFLVKIYPALVERFSNYIFKIKKLNLCQKAWQMLADENCPVLDVILLLTKLGLAYGVDMEFDYPRILCLLNYDNSEIQADTLMFMKSCIYNSQACIITHMDEILDSIASHFYNYSFDGKIWAIKFICQMIECANGPQCSYFFNKGIIHIFLPDIDEYPPDVQLYMIDALSQFNFFELLKPDNVHEYFEYDLYQILTDLLDNDDLDDAIIGNIENLLDELFPEIE